MRAAIINPYLDTLGGGERYSIFFAKVLAKNGYDIDIEWKNPSIKNELENRFGVSLLDINILPDVKKGEGYDICFWVSDGSVPLMHSRRNILHFQVPFHGVSGKSLLNRMKFFRIDNIVCNSQFTKNVIDAEFGINSLVIYPPVDTKSFRPKRKENVILYVGRFSTMLQSKGQEILITAFKKLINDENNNDKLDWKLVLAGGAEVGVDDQIDELRKGALGYPVEIITSPDFRTLKDLYGKAKIFWSASGFGQDEEKNPEKMEHFGITVVEAMAAGVVPIVYDGGGYKEIVVDGQSGYLWNNTGELVKKAKELMFNNKQLHNFEKSVIKKAGDFSLIEFEKNIVSNVLSI